MPPLSSEGKTEGKGKAKCGDNAATRKPTIYRAQGEDHAGNHFRIHTPKKRPDSLESQTPLSFHQSQGFMANEHHLFVTFF